MKVYTLDKEINLPIPIKNRTIMKDLVYYSLPFYMIGSITHSLFVKRKLDHIFDYRTRVISDIFKIN